MTPVTSPCAVAASTSARTESRDVTSTIAVLTSNPALRIVSAAASGVGVAKVSQHHVLAGANPPRDRSSDRPRPDDDNDFVGSRPSAAVGDGHPGDQPAMGAGHRQMAEVE
jgi:hypothetical protein